PLHRAGGKEIGTPGFAVSSCHPSRRAVQGCAANFGAGAVLVHLDLFSSASHSIEPMAHVDWVGWGVGTATGGGAVALFRNSSNLASCSSTSFPVGRRTAVMAANRRFSSSNVSSVRGLSGGGGRWCL